MILKRQSYTELVLLSLNLKKLASAASKGKNSCEVGKLRNESRI